VQPEGPAASIGIQPGDLILAIDGHYLYSIDDLRSEPPRLLGFYLVKEFHDDVAGVETDDGWTFISRSG
jgi:hypothetical protein